MKKSTAIVTLVAIIVCAFCLSIYSPSIFSSDNSKNANEIQYKEGKLSKQDRIDIAMQQEFELTKDLSLNEVPRERLLAADSYRKLLIESSTSSRTSAAVPGLIWQERGPNNVGGRTRALLYDLNDAANGYKKVWAGSVAGGLWYTNDITAGLPVWNKIDDQFENLAITSIVQNPANPQEMYFGTGEGWFNADAVRGFGIWKSIDGGSTWSHLLSTSIFFYVNDLLIDKEGNLYASVRDYSGSGASGIQKTTDGGFSWTKVLGSPIFGSSNRGADLELAANGDIYASLGTTSSNGGIYMSDYVTHGLSTGNVGTWENITPDASATISTPSNYWQRIELATAPSNANIVYALLQGNGSSNCTSIQQYNRATGTWAVKTVPTIIDQGSNSIFTRGQAWYDLAAAVDPNNESVVYIGGVDALRSDNEGSTWTQITTWSLFGATGFTGSQNVHADHHAIVFAPGSSSRAVWGSDGGIHYTSNADNGPIDKPIFQNKNNGYNVTQYYGLAMSPTNTNYFLAGAQDNGTQKFSTAGMNITTQASGGDGAFCHIDQDNHDIQISSYVYNNYYISTNGGASFSSRSFGNTGSFINPTDYDNAGNILYGGHSSGSFFRWNDPATGGSSTNTVSCPEFSSGSVTHITVSPTVANRVFFGLNNGSVVVVDDANTGTSINGRLIKTGSGSVSCIAIDPNNADHLLVTYSNYGATSVYETQNASAVTPTWTAVEGNLPDMPVRWAMFDPRNSDWAILATELGIWSTMDLAAGATDWQPTNSGMANVRVDMLQYRASDRTIAAATHGRGLFTAQIPMPLPVTLVNFQGQLDKATVKLSWSTSSEQNSKQFDIEKSTDGVNYFTIGEVNAAGNSSTRKDYSFSDGQISPMNYYRLRMIDLDRNSKLSHVVLIKTNDARQNIWVVNNPFKDYIDIRFATNTRQVKLQLVNMSGTVVLEKQLANPSGQVRWPISASLSKGTYFLRATADGRVTTNKLIKE